MDFYSAEITEFFRHPKLAGQLTGKQCHHIKLGYEDTVQLSIELNDNIIVDARFLAHGFMTLIAAAEYVCQQIKGGTLDAAKQLTTEQVNLALNMPPHRYGSTLLVIEALQQLCDNLQP